MEKKLIDFFSNFITEKRIKLFDKVLEKRSRYLTVVLEDIYQAHNASAVLRSCDCFGFQDVHIIENKNEYYISPDVAMGSSKWLNLERYNNKKNNTLEAIQKLRDENYRIIATTPHKNAKNLQNFDINKGKFAVFFGTEMSGLSKKVFENSDEYLKIDMFGFTESLNISVSVATILHHLRLRLEKSKIIFLLKEKEKLNIKLDWMRRSIKKSNLLEKEFYRRKNLEN